LSKIFKTPPKVETPGKKIQNSGILKPKVGMVPKCFQTLSMMYGPTGKLFLCLSEQS